MPLLTLLLACTSALDDPDNDFLNASEEAVVGTDVNVADHDGDGLNDGYEVYCSNTDPTDPDQDRDGDEDGWEWLRGLSPANPEQAGYPDGASMLTLEQKLSLRPETAPDVAQVTLPLRRTSLNDPTRGRYDLYDLALQGQPILLTTVPFQDEPAMLAALERQDLPTPDAAGVFARVRAGELTLVWVTYDGPNGGPRAIPDAQAALQPATQALPALRTLVDRGFELWGHLGRPEQQRWVLLDERMIVLAIDDWEAIRDVVL
jgi:hypothetical protein